MRKKRAMRGIGWWGHPLTAKRLSCGHSASKQTNRRRLNIAFNTGNLPSKAQFWFCLQPQLRVKQTRRIDKGITVQSAEPCKLCIFKTRDRLKHPHLFAMFQLCLKPNHIIQRAKRIILTKLDNRMGAGPIMRIGKANWLHWPPTQRFTPA